MNKKKMKPADIIMDCIIGGVILVLVFVVGGMILSKMNSNSGKKEDSAKVTTKPVEKEDGVIKYQCVIPGGSNNTTIFGISFYEKDHTYREYLQAGDQESPLDEGSYKEENGKFIATSKEDQSRITYLKDGDYILVEDGMYQGTLPDGDRFEGTFVYEVKNEFKNTLTFKKDGTYQETVTSYAAKDSSEKDTTKTTTGTYKRNEDTIERVSDNGEPLLDFRIYENQISTAYYELVQ